MSSPTPGPEIPSQSLFAACLLAVVGAIMAVSLFYPGLAWAKVLVVLVCWGAAAGFFWRYRTKRTR